MTIFQQAYINSICSKEIFYSKLLIIFHPGRICTIEAITLHFTFSLQKEKCQSKNTPLWMEKPHRAPPLQQEIQAVSDYEDWENPFSLGVRTLIGSNFMWPGLNTGTYKQYKQHQIDLERYTCVYALSSLCLSDTHTLTYSWNHWIREKKWVGYGNSGSEWWKWYKWVFM